MSKHSTFALPIRSLLVLAATGLMAAPNGARAAEAKQAENRAGNPALTGHGFSVPVQTVEPGMDEGTNITPNEFRHDYFMDAVKGRRGIYAGVGSFRVLNTTAEADFDKIMIVDYDKRVTDYMSADIEMIALSSNRREHLALLLLGRVPEGLAEAVRGQGTDEQFLNQLKEEVRGGRFHFDENPLLAKMSPEASATYRKLSADGTLAEVAKEMTLEESRWHFAALDRYVKNGTWDKTLFGSDRIFKKIQARIAEGKYEIVNGSIAGDKTANFISETARASGLKVSVIDISNADAHVARAGQLANMSKFLKALPASENAVVLSSSKEKKLQTGFFGGDEKKDHWRYYVHSISDYTRKLDEALLRPHATETQALHQVLAEPAK